jgi:4-hydroxybenzoyl-CoA reductase subunit beta
VASASADLPPLLIALGAEVRVAREAGSRTSDLAALYSGDGAAPIALERDELLVEIAIPLGGARAAYQKLRARAAIDFPLLGVAVALDVDGGVCRGLRIVAAGTTPAPRVIGKLDAVALGRPLGRDVIEAIAERCRASLHPLTTLGDDTAYRRAMIPVLVRRAFAELGFAAES